MTPQAIEEHMQLRLKAAAATHRAHWRVDEMPEANDGDVKSHGDQPEEDSEEAEPEDNRVVLVPDKYPTPSPQKPQTDPPSTPPHNGINYDGAHDCETPSKKVSSPARQLPNQQDGRYTRQPPVLYGLFIVNTSVMVLTIDSAKEGDDAYVSYQVEVGFSKRYQAVWNAITIAIVVCLARDAMIDMKDDFNYSIIDGDSDPDA